MRPCATCPALIETSSRCSECLARRRRGSRQRNGRRDVHSSSAAWRESAAAFVAQHVVCVGCGSRSEVADHVIPRRVLVARGIANPDAWRWLQPLCKRCHDRKTATVDGGFGAPIRLDF